MSPDIPRESSPRDSSPRESTSRESSPRKDTPAGNDADKSGYAERTPRDRDDARNLGKPRRQDPDQGGLDRKPEDTPDTAADEG